MERLNGLSCVSLKGKSNLRKWVSVWDKWKNFFEVWIPLGQNVESKTNLLIETLLYYHVCFGKIEWDRMKERIEFEQLRSLMLKMKLIEAWCILQFRYRCDESCPSQSWFPKTKLFPTQIKSSFFIFVDGPRSFIIGACTFLNNWISVATAFKRPFRSAIMIISRNYLYVFFSSWFRFFNQLLCCNNVYGISTWRRHANIVENSGKETCGENWLEVYQQCLEGS